MNIEKEEEKLDTKEEKNIELKEIKVDGNALGEDDDEEKIYTDVMGNNFEL